MRYGRLTRKKRNLARISKQGRIWHGAAARRVPCASDRWGSDLAATLLESIADLGERAVCVSDQEGHVLWEAGDLGQFGDALGPGGVLAPVTLKALAPGAGDVVLPDGRVVRWTSRAVARLRPALDVATSDSNTLSWTFEDVTNARRVERALEDAEGRLRLFRAHMRGIVFELDSQARFVRVCASDPRLLARPEEELLGRTLLETLGSDVGRRHHDAVRATVETGEPANYQYELDVPSGHLHFACESVAVPAGTGGERHAVFWIRDVTAQVRLQRKLIETERLASLGALAAGVAHEINNPLGYMMLNLEQLRRTFHRAPWSNQQELAALRASVDIVHDGARHVQRIVRDLLQLARPNDPIEPVDVCQIVAYSVELVRELCEHRARLEVELPEDAPRVLAHDGRLVQVFTNLLMNAADAVGTGAPEENRIAVSVRSGGTDTVAVAFHDTGVGIPREHLRRVFDPFFTTKNDGTGLGLTICESIVRSYSGDIQLGPQDPKGTVVRVLLPAAVRAPVRPRSA